MLFLNHDKNISREILTSPQNLARVVEHLNQVLKAFQEFQE